MGEEGLHLTRISIERSPFPAVKSIQVDAANHRHFHMIQLQ